MMDAVQQEQAQCTNEIVDCVSGDSREPSPVVSTENIAPESTVAISSHVKKEAAKARRREDKAIETVLKALGSLESTEEKLAALCKKYADLLEENRLLQQKFKQSQKSLSVIMKEKDQLQSDHGKAVLAKSKLESLCRELQRHNKLIKEESVARAKEEEEKRKEVTSKFQTTINDIQSQMNDHYQKNTKLREENIELAGKLKNLIEQYELREQHIEKVFKHKELEGQLADAKLEQANLQLSEAKERASHEREALIADAVDARQKVNVLEEQEKQLRAQVALYTEKYEEFQKTLSKSNDVFQSFKSEMEKMTKKIQKLEKETNMWKKRWENSNRALLEMAEEKTKNDNYAKQLNSKISKLESLCRALQEERNKNPAPNGVVPAESATENTKRIDAEPTRTPPNTPEQSRSSPVTVQGEQSESAAAATETETPPPQQLSDGDKVTNHSAQEKSTPSVQEAVSGEPDTSEAPSAKGDVKPEVKSDEQTSQAIDAQ